MELSAVPPGSQGEGVWDAQLRVEGTRQVGPSPGVPFLGLPLCADHWHRQLATARCSVFTEHLVPARRTQIRDCAYVGWKVLVVEVKSWIEHSKEYRDRELQRWPSSQHAHALAYSCL